MKTPKRHYDLTTMEHSASERVWDRPQEEVSAARWKRKNRVKQLKRTIARLKREKEEAYHRMKREKEEAYHRGHQAGYDLCFARSWF